MVGDVLGTLRNTLGLISYLLGAIRRLLWELCQDFQAASAESCSIDICPTTGSDVWLMVISAGYMLVRLHRHALEQSLMAANEPGGLCVFSHCQACNALAQDLYHNAFHA